MNKSTFLSLKITIALIAGIAIGWFARESQQTPVAHHNPSFDEPAFIQPLTATIERNESAHLTTQQTPSPVASNDDLPVLLNSLLKQHKFEAVIALFDALQQNNKRQQLEQTREIILRFTHKLIAQKDYISAKKLLNDFLVSSNRHVATRMLLAEVHKRLADYQSAIDTLYIAKGHAIELDDINAINKNLRLLVTKQAHLFKQEIKYRELRILYEKLTEQEADYAPYFIGLAEAQDMLGDFDAARNSLQIILNHPEVGSLASAMLAELQARQPQPSRLTTDETAPDKLVETETEPASSVSLFKQGNHYLLDAEPSNGETIRLLIDTGASLTTMTLDALRKNNIQYKDTGEVRRFSTANGFVDAPIYQLDYLTIGKWRVNDIRIAALDLQGQGGTQGLLGMNFLQHFRFFIDQQNSLLYLSLRE
ncbi:hypothetical protein MNBD_GAMMA08-1466 [hydrothermal vent metagenome]|uniref:Peptidase A2 domain-containing protein n=1 Tax=hydrothermal vent metagenome TaxID=652676 RepID=A0A3B0WQP9_9ZZZZ